MTTIPAIEYLPAQPYKKVVKPVKAPFALKIVRLGFQVLGRLFPNAAADLAFKFFSTPRIRAKHKRSDSILEKATIFELLYANKILKAYQWGEGQKTILLVHGWESRGTALRGFVPKLVEKGYKVVTFDAPAHGDSAGKTLNILHYAGAIKAIINHVNGVEGVICHSFGGAAMIVSLATYEYDIPKLTLIGVPHKIDIPVNAATEQLGLPPVVKKRFRKKLESLTGYRVEDLTAKELQKKIKVNEMLIIHDEHDEVIPFWAAEYAFNTWNNATLVVTKGDGHYRIMKNPAVIERVASFYSSIVF